MTRDAKNIQQATPFEGHDQFYTSNGQGLHISPAGSSSFSSTFHPHTQLTINNLRLIPFITKKLMSFSQFSKDNHVYFLFSVDKCLIKSQEYVAILLEGHVGTDILYEFPSIPLSSTASLPFCLLMLCL